MLNETERNAAPREQIAGAHRHPFGTQLHPSCFGVAAESGYDRGSVLRGFHHLMRTTVDSLTNCMARYPELGFAPARYIPRTLAQLRRTVVMCSNLDNDEFGVYGMNWPVPLFLPRGFREGEHLNVRPNSTNRPTILFARNAFLRDTVQSYGRNTTIQNLFIHEILHSSGADNRLDHGHIENVIPHTGNLCGEDQTLDRISMVTGICSGGYFADGSGVGRGSTILQQLTRRMQQCGASNGCVNLFSGENNTLGIVRAFHPSVDMDPAVAQVLCARIQTDGECLSLRVPRERTNRESWQLHPYARFEPHLMEFRQRLQNRLSEVMPRLHHQIPGGFLRLKPEWWQAIRQSENSPCFRAIFARDRDGGLILKPWARSRYSRGQEGLLGRSNSEDPLTYFMDSRNRLEDIFAEISTQWRAGLRHPHCQAESEDSRGELSRLFLQIQFEAGVLSHSQVLANAITRAVGYAEVDVDLNLFQFQDDDHDATTRAAIQRFLGPDLFRGYRQALERYSPYSPLYECPEREQQLLNFAAQEAAYLPNIVQSVSNRPRRSCP